MLDIFITSWYKRDEISWDEWTDLYSTTFHILKDMSIEMTSCVCVCVCVCVKCNFMDLDIQPTRSRQYDLILNIDSRKFHSNYQIDTSSIVITIIIT